MSAWCWRKHDACFLVNSELVTMLTLTFTLKHRCAFTVKAQSDCKLCSESFPSQSRAASEPRSPHFVNAVSAKNSNVERKAAKIRIKAADFTSRLSWRGGFWIVYIPTVIMRIWARNNKPGAKIKSKWKLLKKGKHLVFCRLRFHFHQALRANVAESSNI